MNLQFVSILIAHPAWDIIVLLSFIGVGFLCGISAGRAKLIAILISLYVSGFIFEKFYFIGTIVKGRNIFEEFLFRAFIFGTFVAVIAVLFSKVLAKEGDYSGEKRWWKALLLSFSITGLLFSYAFHLFPIRNVFEFSPLIQQLFASNTSFFWWLLAPLAALFLARI